MPQARPLLLGAVLLALALPGHPHGLLSGVPLDLPALGLLLLVVGWWIALPGAPPRAGMLATAVLLLGVVRVAFGWVAPSYGLVGEYRVEDRPVAVRNDPALDFRGDTFPVHFFNDIQRFNYYTPNEPKRDLLPFTARWTGLLVVPEDGIDALSLESNGPATLELGTGQRVAIEKAGRIQDATMTVSLPAGLVPISVTYARPDEAMPWLVVRAGTSGDNGLPLRPERLVREGTSLAAIARDTWLRPLARTVDGLVVGLLALAFAVHAWTVVRGANLRSTTPHPRSVGAVGSGRN